MSPPEPYGSPSPALSCLAPQPYITPSSASKVPSLTITLSCLKPYHSPIPSLHNALSPATKLSFHQPALRPSTTIRYLSTTLHSPSTAPHYRPLLLHLPVLSTDTIPSPGTILVSPQPQIISLAFPKLFNPLSLHYPVPNPYIPTLTSPSPSTIPS